METQNDSQMLRNEFCQNDIEDGWVIIAQGDGEAAYGYGSRDLLMYLKDKNGGLFCQESSCCSCNGIEGSFDPVPTNIETIKLDLKSYQGANRSPLKAGICMEALRALEEEDLVRVKSLN